MEILEKIENVENNIQAQEKEALDNFHNEIQELKEQEEKGEFKTVHLKDVNPDELTFEDMEMWDKYKNKKITMDDVDDYYKKIWQAGYEKNKEKVSASRQFFEAFLANKAGGLFFERNKFKKESIKKSSLILNYAIFLLSN